MTTEPFVRTLNEDTTAINELDRAIMAAAEDALLVAGRYGQALQQGELDIVLLDEAISSLVAAAELLRRGVALIVQIQAGGPSGITLTAQTQEWLDELRAFYLAKLGGITELATAIRPVAD